MRKIGTLVAVTLMATSMLSSIYAYEFHVRSLAELFSDSLDVARIEVLSAQVFTAVYNSEVVHCGYLYSAKVIRSYKEANTRVQFATRLPLTIGKQYLVFLSNKFRDGAINFVFMGNEKWGEYNACTSSGVRMYVSMMHGEIYEIIGDPDSTESSASIKVFSLDEPFDGSTAAEKIELSSPKLDDDDLELMSYWRISWSSIESKLLFLSKKEQSGE